MTMAEYIDREKAKRLLHIEYAYAAEQLLDEIPAADVAPVVHGRWGDDGSGIIICSECGRGYNLIPRYTNFCPNCGAKMDGGDSNEAD